MNLTRPPIQRMPARRLVGVQRPGFTLSEVLVAIGILALGTVAVASLFPTAAFLQKEAVKETLRQNHIRSADATLEGVGLDNLTMLEFVELMERGPTGPYAPFDVRAGIADRAFDVYALAEIDRTIDSSFDIGFMAGDMTQNAGGIPDFRMNGDFTDADLEASDSFVYGDRNTGVGPAIRGFPIAMRSLPSLTPPFLVGPAPGVPSYVNREVFWVPLVRAGLEASESLPDWSVYAFILQPDSQLRNNNAYALRTDPTIGVTGVTYPGNYGFMDDPDIVCANPDLGAYVPKVFRVPVTWNARNPNRATPSVNLFGFVKPGEKMLGDNGVIYRVSQIDPTSGTMILAEDTEFTPINQRDLGAIWVAPAPGGINESSPLADIRLLSNTVVRTNDF